MLVLVVLLMLVLLLVLLVLLVGALVVLVVMVLLVFPSFTIYMCGCSEMLCNDYSNNYALSIVVGVYTISELICSLYLISVS